MKTLKDWNKSGLNFTEFVNAGDRIDSKLYDYFLGVVPPRLQTKNNLLMGEPFSINSKGEHTYMAFTISKGMYFYQGLKSVNDVKHRGL